MRAYRAGMLSARSRPTARRRPPDAQLDLAPSLTDRVVGWVRPDRLRRAAVRKIIAAILAAAGIALLFRGDPASETVAAVVTTRDLTPGHVIADADLATRDIAVQNLADGALADIGDAVGKTVAGPVRAGEALTDVRVLGPRLAGLAVGTDDARIVPVRLADPAVADIVRSGDVVDVLTAGTDTPNVDGENNAPRVLAAGAVVVLTTSPKDARNQHEQVTMLALPTPSAHLVAAASLTSAVTLTFR